MRRITPDQAIERAKERLYTSPLDRIDKSLDSFLKAKKFASRNLDKKE